MHIIIVAIMVAVVCVIGMMLQRIYQGPTVYDRMNGLGVTGADTILLADDLRNGLRPAVN